MKDLRKCCFMGEHKEFAEARRAVLRVLSLRFRFKDSGLQGWNLGIQLGDYTLKPGLWVRCNMCSNIKDCKTSDLKASRPSTPKS